MKILITGGTVFASRYTAEYFAKNHEVYVLNRNTRPQSHGVTLINRDRHELSDILKNQKFDAVIDVTVYNERDASDLLNALENVNCYIMVSSSAVYPETLPQPFTEEMTVGANTVWRDYGTDKIAAENYVRSKLSDYYIIRPPYLYGKMNNLYREAFAFECAERNLPFYIPKNGKMPLQFFDIEDMCRFIEILLNKRLKQRVFNVGNPYTVDICKWVQLCYGVLGKTPEFAFVNSEISQREYFPFHDYGYELDVTEMIKLMPDVKPIERGLSESYDWFSKNREAVRRKPYFEFIEKNLL